MSGFWIEAVGYAGSTLVILSLLQKSILRLRSIGVVASTTFLLYSLAIGAYPIAVVNVVAATIHLYHLRRLVRRKSEVFKLLRISPESRYLDYFLDFYVDDIATTHNAGFSYEPGPKTLAVLLLRDLVPAGLVIANTHGDSSIEILLDYVIPQYRDFELARWLYSGESGFFDETSCNCAWTRVTTPEQEEYYTRVGFRPDRTPNVPERHAFILAD
jgi:hypothetical protein